MEGKLDMSNSDIKLISASAGSGKTYRLMQLVHEEVEKGLKAQGLVAVTFTNKAAQELKQRIREKLVESGRLDEARSMASAKIGTVHSVCGEILKRFSFEEGSSPRQKILDEESAKSLFSVALNEVLTDEVNQQISKIGYKFSMMSADLISDIKNLASKIRENGLTESSIKESLKLSLDKIPLVTDEPRGNSSQDNLIRGLETFLRTFPKPPEKPKNTIEAYQEVVSIYDLAKKPNQSLPWLYWVKLTKLTPGKDARDAFAPLIETARSFLSNGELRSDYKHFINLVYDLAQKSSLKFAEKKKALGVLDYGDLEEKTLKLLENKKVQADLSSELDVLFVDEFQDTNPMQLAIFLKLTSLCKKSVWVGDIKQSIYRFRGADPELMKSVIKELGKGETEVLDSNWRSVPTVVNFVNSVFTLGLEVDGIAKKEIYQKPEWKHKISTDGLEVWDGTGKNKGERTNRLANAITALLTSRIEVTDKNTNLQRQIRGGDIAILCLKNSDCEELSIALSELGIASAVVGGSLLELPEISLALSAFRYLINSRDTIAASEIALALGSDKDEWLKLAINKTKSESWHPALERISKSRELTSEMSISEKLDLAMSLIPIDEVIEKMEHGDSRTFRISALRQQVKAYEENCKSSFLPCTDLGFLEFLKSSEPKIPSSEHSDAVTILTYHRSKGLEWPVVIMASLEKELRDPDLFGVRQEIVAGTTFNPKEPLKGRIVTYLPWPFAKQSNIPELDAKLQGLQDLVDIKYSDDSEMRRLLYVGMTRAREKLVLLNTIKNGDVVNSILGVLVHGGLPVISFNPDKSVIVSGKDEFTCVYKAAPVELAQESRVERKLTNTSLPHGTPISMDTQPLYLQPSHLNASQAGEIKIGKTYNWGSRLILKRVNDQDRADLVGTAVHLFLCSDTGKSDIVEEILKNWNLKETLDVAELIKASNRLQSTIKELWPNGKVFREVPMEMSFDGSIVRGAIDCLVVTDDQVAVIDHKTLKATAEEMTAVGNKYKHQLSAYAEAVQRHFNNKKITTWIHNPDGWMCEVILNRNS